MVELVQILILINTLFKWWNWRLLFELIQAKIEVSGRFSETLVLFLSVAVWFTVNNLFHPLDRIKINFVFFVAFQELGFSCPLLVSKLVYVITKLLKAMVFLIAIQHVFSKTWVVEFLLSVFLENTRMVTIGKLAEFQGVVAVVSIIIFLHAFEIVRRLRKELFLIKEATFLMVEIQTSQFILVLVAVHVFQNTWGADVCEKFHLQQVL